MSPVPPTGTVSNWNTQYRPTFHPTRGRDSPLARSTSTEVGRGQTSTTRGRNGVAAGRGRREDGRMCRNITTLRGLEPAATAEEIEAAARQYVRKVSGVQATSRASEEAFELAVR